jgi:hypothetical protein
MRQTGRSSLSPPQSDRPLHVSRGGERGKVVELSSQTPSASADGTPVPSGISAPEKGSARYLCRNHRLCAQIREVDAIAKVGSSALCVLPLQPLFVEKDGGKCSYPQYIMKEVLLLAYASVLLTRFCHPADHYTQDDRDHYCVCYPSHSDLPILPTRFTSCP